MSKAGFPYFKGKNTKLQYCIKIAFPRLFVFDKDRRKDICTM